MRILLGSLLGLAIFTAVLGQESTVRPRTASSAQSPSPPTSDAVKPTTARSTSQAATGSQSPASAAVLAAFERLLNGIKKAEVKTVTDIYWNSPQLILFNYNGTVTKGWEQLRQNRESSYPKIKNVDLQVKDVSVVMLGRDGAVVSCLWTQSQNYDGVDESASGRMTLVFRRTGNNWRAVHLHTSPDKEDPSRVPRSEQESSPASPTP